MTAAVRFSCPRVQCFVLTALPPISPVSSQQLTQGECPHWLLARRLSVCLRVCERGPGPVISQIYYSSGVGRQAGVIRAGMGSSARLGPSGPTACVCVCVFFRSAPRPQPTDDVHAWWCHGIDQQGVCCGIWCQCLEREEERGREDGVDGVRWRETEKATENR